MCRSGHCGTVGSAEWRSLYRSGRDAGGFRVSARRGDARELFVRARNATLGAAGTAGCQGAPRRSRRDGPNWPFAPRDEAGKCAGRDGRLWKAAGGWVQTGAGLVQRARYAALAPGGRRYAGATARDPEHGGCSVANRVLQRGRPAAHAIAGTRKGIDDARGAWGGPCALGAPTPHGEPAVGKRWRHGWNHTGGGGYPRSEGAGAGDDSTTAGGRA